MNETIYKKGKQIGEEAGRIIYSFGKEFTNKPHLTFMVSMRQHKRIMEILGIKNYDFKKEITDYNIKTQ